MVLVLQSEFLKTFKGRGLNLMSNSKCQLKCVNYLSSPTLEIHNTLLHNIKFLCNFF